MDIGRGVSGLLIAGAILLPPAVAAEPVRLYFEVRGADGGLLPCRIHVSDGSDTLFAPPGLPAFKNHFSCPGTAELALEPGVYDFTIERGPEFRRAVGRITLSEGGGGAAVRVRLSRLANMKSEGWWSGDLHVHRPPEDMEAIMRAEDLHVAPVITWWNERNLWRDRPLPDPVLLNFDGDRYCHLMAGEDERGGGAFMFFNLESPVDITGADREYPSQTHFLPAVKSRGGWVDLEKPFWWDAPIGIGLGLVDSIGIANNHMWRHGMLDNEAWGRPRPSETEPPAYGGGLWTQEIYYHVLNAGLRIPPSAGSASGVIPNPVGYNRVYVQLDGPMEHAAWWEGLRAGRSFVTNGPLLRVTADGQWPGHVFRGAGGAPVSIALAGVLDSDDPVRTIQLIRDGNVEQEFSPEAFMAAGATMTFDRSGWFLVRAIADLDHTFRFASTAPWYVEIGGEGQPVRRESVEFFLDWIDRRKAALELPEGQKAEVLMDHDRARAFWSKKLAGATR
ncbi:MAG: CehA/McbA family metallohydrolase [Candidatus Hydrogenedentes bacterium]|nr:CehA/McbA family metallohydrolase [Candidatus Hydrogenedentota bacterium]